MSANAPAAQGPVLDTVNQPNVLIVDDAEGLREVLALRLGRERYRVSLAGTAQEGLDAVSRHRYDLILLDLNLPDMSGLDFLNTLRQTRSILDVPVIVISGMDQPGTVVKALQNGANDYVTKPFELTVVLARIKTQLALKYLKELNDRFLRTAGHDLKKPVMLMIDVARRVREDIPPGSVMTADAHSALDLLIESGDFMQQIIDGVLDLKAIKDGRLNLTKVPTDLGAIVRQAVARNTAYAKSKGIELTLKFEDKLPQIIADDLRLMQVLDNLIGNAIKFSPAAARILVATRRQAESLLCEVIDTGPGIDPADMHQLFTEYAQLRNRPTGQERSSGLGLAICKELITLHGGRIGARNNDTGGATFWFEVPIA